jgi:AAR2 protein
MGLFDTAAPTDHAVGGGVVIFLNLPAHDGASSSNKSYAELCLNGQTIVVKRHDFLGFQQLPLNGFTLLTVRVVTGHSGGGPGPQTVGFVLFQKAPRATVDLQVIRYNTQLEEAELVQDEDTLLRLRHSILETSQQLRHVEASSPPPPHMLVPFHQLFQSQQHLDSWKELTNWITPSFLSFRNVRAKIVAAPYQEHDLPSTPSTNVHEQAALECCLYPPIPVWHGATNSWALPRQHRGTRQFFTALSPTDRTALYRTPALLLDQVLSRHYQGNWAWLLGDLQWSLLLFRQVQCYASLVHWRDLWCLVCGASGTWDRQPDLYRALLPVLTRQWKLLAKHDWAEVVEESDGPSVLTSMHYLVACLSPADDPDLQREVSALADEIKRTQVLLDLGSERPHSRHPPTADEEDESDNDSGPVVIPLSEVQESQRRAGVTKMACGNSIVICPAIREQYPLLMAAMQPYEDILMTCARALDEQVDVSLVREAAAYLENMESVAVADE